MSAPKLIRYSSGLFKLYTPNLPESIRNDKEYHNKILGLVQAKYTNYSWGKCTPTEKFNEINEFVYSLVKDL